MSHRQFLIQLLTITVVTGVVLVFLHILQQFSPYKPLSLFSLVFFALLSMAMYFPAAKSAHSRDRNAFTRLLMVFSFVKMFLAAAIVIGYHRLFQPKDSFFLIPYFLVYIVFTGFETVFMSKLGRVKPVQ